MWNKPIVLFLSPHWRGEKALGSITRDLAAAQTQWCTRNNVHRVWWGEWIDGDWYRGAANAP
jgi:hypothetical protein